MKRRLAVILLGLGVVVGQSASACFIDWSAFNEGDFSYDREFYEGKNFRVATIVGGKTPDRFEVKTMNDVYFTDRKNVIWNGQLMVNSTEYQPVDIESFKQRSWGDRKHNFYKEYRYASDKNYIYYGGIRTDDNTGVKIIDLEKVRRLNDDYLQGTALDYVIDGKNDYVTDEKSVYYRGKYIGSLGNYKMIKVEVEHCPPTTIYMIVTIDNRIFIDGYFLDNIDSESFEVKEWDHYKKYLHYTDKNGEFIAEFDREQDKYIIEEKR